MDPSPALPWQGREPGPLPGRLLSRGAAQTLSVSGGTPRTHRQILGCKDNPEGRRGCSCVALTAGECGAAWPAISRGGHRARSTPPPVRSCPPYPHAQRGTAPLPSPHAGASKAGRRLTLPAPVSHPLRSSPSHPHARVGKAGLRFCLPTPVSPFSGGRSRKHQLPSPGGEGRG